MPVVVQAQEGGQVPDEVAQTFFQRTKSNSILDAPKAFSVTDDNEASANSYENQSEQLCSYGSINDRFTEVQIEPMIPADRKADENEQIIDATEIK